MISELFRKWFGLDPISCDTCEVLREQLASSERERRDLLTRLLEKDKAEPSTVDARSEPVPIHPQFVPWRVRQQMLEAEDRKIAQIKKSKEQEIANLEKELGVTDAAQ